MCLRRVCLRRSACGAFFCCARRCLRRLSCSACASGGYACGACPADSHAFDTFLWYTIVGCGSFRRRCRRRVFVLRTALPPTVKPAALVLRTATRSALLWCTSVGCGSFTLRCLSCGRRCLRGIGYSCGPRVLRMQLVMQRLDLQTAMPAAGYLLKK